VAKEERMSRNTTRRVSCRDAESFDYGAGTVYKDGAVHVMGLIVAALQAAQLPLTLRTLYEVSTAEGVCQLARIPALEPQHVQLRRDLSSDTTTKGNPDEEQLKRRTLGGINSRLGTLLQGAFGELMGRPNPLNLFAASAGPGITYIPLRTTANTEDVALMGRVLLLECQQVAGARLADQWGTKDSPKVTIQTGGERDLGSIRAADEYLVNPNALRYLDQGRVIVRTRRRPVAYVHVFPHPQ
jgi:hypothetical protein